MVRDSYVVLGLPDLPPAKMLEESDVRGLDERHHLPAATLPGRGHREADQRGAEPMPPAEPAGHRQPVPLPAAGGQIHRVQPDRAADNAIDESHDVNHMALPVVLVTVISRENALLMDEDLAPDRVVGGHFHGGPHGTALHDRPPLRDKAGPDRPALAGLSSLRRAEAGCVHRDPRPTGRCLRGG